MVAAEYDFILVGGGLQSGLIALALRARHPDIRLCVIEKGDRLGGNHTWCFHADDVSPAAREWIAPLVCYKWRGYTVHFPDLEREIHGRYSAITSVRFDEVIRTAVQGHASSDVLLASEVTRVGRSEVELANARVLTSRVVIDARGPSMNEAILKTSGFQKFVGLEVQLSEPHGLQTPTLMDARVDQTDGFRFFYILPLERDTLLIEDTYFHHSPDLDVDSIRSEIIKYAETKNFVVASIKREETGVLPMPWTGSLPSSGPSPVVAGYRGGWFHPATGYSFPVAARVAEYIAGRSTEELATRGLRELTSHQVSQSRYCHLLNRFLFRWYAPSARWHIFARFYRLPMGTITRFYSLQMTFRDKFRLLAGKPPRGLSVGFRMRRSRLK